jgi:hypothetical protein
VIRKDLCANPDVRVNWAVFGSADDYAKLARAAERFRMHALIHN